MGEPIVILDFRDQRPAAQPKSKIRRGRTVIRDPETVDAIMIHQTAVDYGAGGPERSARTPYHAMVFREGWVVKSWPFLSYTYHGNRANSRTIAIGVEGLYPGVVGGNVWGRKPETPITETVLEGLRVAIREVAHECPQVQFLLAHRQSSASRRSDPGEALWKAAVAEGVALGLETLPDWTIGDGRPIPAAWGGAGPY